jgi:hypothetical protein
MNKTKYKRANRGHKQQPAWLLASLAAGGLLLIIGAVFAFRQPSTPKATIEVTGAPKIKVDQEKVDLGDVKLGQEAQVSFQITNVGDQALRFSDEPYVEVKEGC